jgi:hypothetical protein
MNLANMAPNKKPAQAMPTAPAGPNSGKSGGGFLNAIGLGKNSFTAKPTYNAYQTNKKAIGGFEDYLNQQKAFDPTAGQQAEVRGQQMRLGQSFEDMIAGNGPSVAQQQLMQGQEAALKNAAALGASQSARGGGFGGINRQMMQQAAQGSQDVAQQAAMLRAQEQQQAMGQYGQFLGQNRGQDLQAQQQAASEQQFATQMKSNLLAMGMSNEQAEQQTQAALEQQRLKAQGEKRGFFGKLLGGAARLGAGLLTGGASELALGAGKLITGGGGATPGAASATPTGQMLA